MKGDATTRAFALLVAVTIVVATAPAMAGAHANDAEPSFVVTVDADGSAEIDLTLTYDLTTDSEQEAFERLQNNQTARDAMRTRFRNRMEAVADDAENATGRTMAIQGASIDLSTTHGGATGVVVLSVTWTGLAAVEDGQLVVTEPFASGFEPDRTFVVKWPGAYELAEATPEPDTTTQGSATWEAGTDLQGFELTLARTTPTATETGTESPADGGAPGFGTGIALVALVGALLGAFLLTNRRQ